MPAKRGLYSNIAAKRRRIKAGSGERMRKPGTKGTDCCRFQGGRKNSQENLRRKRRLKS